LSSRSWGIGPALGGQYLSVKNKTNEYGTFDVFGFNIGIHGKANLTDNLLINGGWRYTNAKEDANYHFFYVGLAYAFQTR
jgi:opacity protein-like surface antigen